MHFDRCGGAYTKPQDETVLSGEKGGRAEVGEWMDGFQASKGEEGGGNRDWFDATSAIVNSGLTI